MVPVISETVVIALVVSIISPLIVSIISNRQRRNEQLEDYTRRSMVATRAEETERLLLERQNIIAEKVQEAANLLAIQQRAVSEKAEETASLLLESNERVAKSALLTNGKLDQIHTLVNSNMTAAMTAVLDAREISLQLMKEVSALKAAAGRPPSKSSISAINQAQKKVSKIKADLAHRLKQTEISEKQINISEEKEKRI